MLVRVKKSVGNYGLVRNGTITPKNFSSGFFEVTDEEGCNMLRRGIAEAAEESAAEAAAPTSPDNGRKRKKRKAVKLTQADDAPSFNAESAIC